MTQILILAMFLFMGWGVAWSGGWPRVTPESKTQRVLDSIHLISITLAAVIMISMPLLTEFIGSPVLAYASGIVLLASLPIFPLKMRYPLNVLSPAKAIRAKPVSEQQRLSRWPFSFAWTVGYILAGCYIASINGRLPLT